ncbi:ATP-binding protein [Bacillus cereus]|uniref:ATP-binding protein n=1 Tax=Bacillus cereus TaxID=1396 RepID=UPI0010BF10C7|nr:ATP-binding protein [Bacillus cereus]TKH33768.1 hypothetical protein FC690_13360 [Bacillus cereus]
MKINHLYIEKAWGLKDIDIDFNEPSEGYFNNAKVSLVVGENGTGKTSILKILSYAFFPSMFEKQKHFPYFDIRYEIGNRNFSLKSDGYVARPSKVIVSSYAVFESFKTNFKNNIKSGSLIKKNGETEYHYCGPRGNGGIPSFQAVIHTVLEAFYNLNSNPKFNKSISLLMSTIGYDGIPAIEVSLPRVLTGGNNYKRENYMRRGNYIREEEYWDSKNLDEERAQLKQEIESRAVERIGKGRYIIPYEHIDGFFLDTLFKFEKSTYFSKIIKDLIFSRNGNGVLFSQMSSGELTMFFRFFPLINLMQDECVILIDEPETHLHPRWIKDYINLIIRLFGDYNSHFIIATHSPLIAADVPQECIIGLKRIGENVQPYYVNEKTLGGETRDILENVFDLENYNGSFTESKKEKIIKLLQESKVREALELYDDLSMNAEKYKFFTEIEHLLPKYGKE